MTKIHDILVYPVPILGRSLDAVATSIVLIDVSAQTS